MTDTVSDDALLAAFRPTFERIAVGAAQRDRDAELALDEMALVRAAGIGAVRLPIERGGRGASIRQLLLLLKELGRADSNLPQALRQHYFQVEMLLHDTRESIDGPWLDKIAAGELFGSGTTEPRGSLLGEVSTVLRSQADGTFRLNGRKIYGTGNAYAQWLPVSAVDDEGRPVFPLIPMDRQGVSLREDWNGFGQRLTATSTVDFADVIVGDHEVRRPAEGGSTRGASGLHQTVLLAALAGVVARAADDLAEQVREKKRVYFTGTGELPRHDAVVQEQVGRARAAADAAALLVDGLGRSMDSAWAVWNAPASTTEQVDEAFIGVELLVSSVQVVLSELALSATSHMLDILGASSLDRDFGFDRHWRNARALTSHNPYPFKARLLGDHELNGALPPEFRAGRDVGDKR
ncbi:MAG: Acyl-CoA dehydrogenase [Frondihabitans sp.]|nr:Acyl-CoA dehydrogenase [Frondihabitans sp.]